MNRTTAGDRSQYTLYMRGKATLLASLLLLGHSTFEVSAQFINIANNTGFINTFGGAPSLGVFGSSMSFQAMLDDGSQAIVVGNVGGGPLYVLANTHGPLSSIGTQTASGDRFLFTATLDPGGSATQGLFGSQVSTVPNFTVYTIVDNSGPFAAFGRPSATRAVPGSNTSAVAFHATLDSGVSGIFYTGHGPAFSPIQTVASTAGGLFTSFGSPSVNNNFSAAFVGFRTAAAGGGSGVFIGTSSGAITTVADTAGSFSGFGNELSFNNNGRVAFRATFDAGGEGVFVGSGSGGQNAIADSSGLFESFTSVALDDSGRVVFRAVLDDGSFGLYSGPDPTMHKIIAFGDSLFGSTVTALELSTDGLANQNYTGFYYALSDGRTGIAITTRGGAIPEPSTWTLFAGGIAALTFRQLRKRSRSC